MPLRSLVSDSIVSSSSSKTAHMEEIAQGVELGLYQWLSVSKVVGVGVGTVGSGVCSGSLVVVPNASLMEGAFKANGLVGVMSPVLWVPIMLGVSQSYAFTGLCSGVGSGSFTGGLVGDPLLLVQLLVSSFTSVGILGADRVRLCTALGQGISGHFSTTVANGVIVGASGPSPSSVPFSGVIV